MTGKDYVYCTTLLQKLQQTQEGAKEQGARSQGAATTNRDWPQINQPTGKHPTRRENDRCLFIIALLS